MMQMTAEELQRFERCWKFVSFVFAICFIVAALDHMLRAPRGWEALGCYVFGGFGLFGCLYAAKKLGDPDRLDATLDALSVLDENMHIPSDLGDVDN